MPQAFIARKYFVPGEPPREEVYKPAPYYYGTLTSDDAATQIAEESSLTKGDVLNVLDRYRHYVATNLQKGYRVELLGFGTIANRFITEKGVSTAEEVKASMVKAIVPYFSPEFTIVNGSRRYALLNEKTSLLKVSLVNGKLPEETTGNEEEEGSPSGI